MLSPSRLVNMRAVFGVFCFQTKMTSGCQHPKQRVKFHALTLCSTFFAVFCECVEFIGLSYCSLKKFRGGSSQNMSLLVAPKFHTTPSVDLQENDWRDLHSFQCCLSALPPFVVVVQSRCEGVICASKNGTYRSLWWMSTEDGRRVRPTDESGRNDKTGTGKGRGTHQSGRHRRCWWCTDPQGTTGC